MKVPLHRVNKYLIVLYFQNDTRSHHGMTFVKKKQTLFKPRLICYRV